LACTQVAICGVWTIDAEEHEQKQKYQVDAIPVGATGVAFHLARDLPRSGSEIRRLDSDCHPARTGFAAGSKYQADAVPVGAWLVPRSAAKQQ
jgi:hypothetical protein